MKPLHLPVALVVAAAASLSVFAQSPPGVEPAIGRIEKALLPPVIVTGRTLQTKTLAERMRELEVPGVSVAVFRDGRIAWTRGWGLADVSVRRKVNGDTRFQAASISKPVAAAVVLALVSRGRLSLDAPVNTYLRAWKLPENEHTAAKPVTLRHLLTHSAGTTVHGFRGYARGEAVPTLVALLDGVKPANSAAVRVDIPVGSRWRYSGGGISIAQLVVEEETGKPFAQTARELVLQPFGMTHSTYVQPLPADLRDTAATGYRSNGTVVAGKWHTYPEQAAAGLWTTPEDLAKFAIELQKIAAGRSNQVMSPTLAQDMLRRQSGEWGLGVGVLGEGAAARFSHGGANEGFRAFWVGYRNVASGVAVMTNSDAGTAVANDLVRTIAHEYGWPGLGPVERTPGTADATTYPGLAGFYELPGRTPPFLRIIADGGRLFRSTGPAGGQRAELLPENPDTFFAADSDLRVQFVRDAAGQVTEARIWQGGQERRAQKSTERR
ncbi:MAG TPA: serine hydrolase [Vicinamibacterales bacterium]|nr:serine hydrolase [Vicinamibacterales bacterium]